MDAMTARPFSAADFRRRAARETGPFSGDDWGDHRLNPDLRELILGNTLRDAAVMIAVVDHGPEASVILTQRTANLRNHASQIAFPGGRIDAADPTPEFAALRETQEEIGLPPDEIEVVGRMPDYVSGSGYRIAPVLGIVRPGFDLSINPHEVDDAFEVPLAFLMDPANHRRDSRVWNERERFFYAMPFEDRHIWGVTAGIIRTMYERLYR
ncbi:CoA pyrophosphatase [Chelativorans sp. ZYF759]|uniref:CoA pyrophosphatase n=1 Tax=Chelativorans sp. ZYF759 TaxID=2692213 RepID=UPI00145FCF69|nr:CoA pyrophosphatase [Chelativorans sp. ZYF759]NMG40180.1 CoA pyrophosphatase [Chelativorans sp. ZYF759]